MKHPLRKENGKNKQSKRNGRSLTQSHAAGVAEMLTCSSVAKLMHRNAGSCSVAAAGALQVVVCPTALLILHTTCMVAYGRC